MKLLWQDDLDDDGKVWKTRLVLGDDWIAKIVRLNTPEPRRRCYHFTIDDGGVRAGTAKTIGEARAVCLRQLLQNAKRIIEALGGTVVPPPTTPLKRGARAADAATTDLPSARRRSR